MLNGLLLIIFVFISFFILTVLYSILYTILLNSVYHYGGNSGVVGNICINLCGSSVNIVQIRGMSTNAFLDGSNLNIRSSVVIIYYDGVLWLYSTLPEESGCLKLVGVYQLNDSLLLNDSTVYVWCHIVEVVYSSLGGSSWCIPCSPELYCSSKVSIIRENGKLPIVMLPQIIVLEFSNNNVNLNTIVLSDNLPSFINLVLADVNNLDISMGVNPVWIAGRVSLLYTNYYVVGTQTRGAVVIIYCRGTYWVYHGITGGGIRLLDVVHTDNNYSWKGSNKVLVWSHGVIIEGDAINGLVWNLSTCHTFGCVGPLIKTHRIECEDGNIRKFISYPSRVILVHNGKEYNMGKLLYFSNFFCFISNILNNANNN